MHLDRRTQVNSHTFIPPSVHVHKTSSGAVGREGLCDTEDNKAKPGVRQCHSTRRLNLPLPVVPVGCGYRFLSLSSVSQAVFFAWSQLRPRGQPSELIMRDCIIFAILRFLTRNRRESTIIIHCCLRKETVKSVHSRESQNTQGSWWPLRPTGGATELDHHS